MDQCNDLDKALTEIKFIVQERHNASVPLYLKESTAFQFLIENFKEYEPETPNQPKLPEADLNYVNQTAAIEPAESTPAEIVPQ